MTHQDYYHIERFSPDELMKMQISIMDYAKPINGLPKHHSEVFSKRGWMLPFLFGYDDLLWGRWNYWFDIIEKGTIEGSGPIPKIKWSQDYQGIEHTRKMIRKCLDHYDSTIDKFADWLTWALAIDKETTIDHISPELNEHYYRHFDLFLVLNYPTDYLSYALSEETGKGYKEALGYFPTPFNLSVAMVEMLKSDDEEAMKRQTIGEPSVGCGSILLAASNYFLRCFAQDISRIAIRLCRIQMYWYAPWFAYHPDTIQGFDQDNIVSIRPVHQGEEESQLVFVL